MCCQLLGRIRKWTPASFPLGKVELKSFICQNKNEAGLAKLFSRALHTTTLNTDLSLMGKKISEFSKLETLFYHQSQPNSLQSDHS